MKFFENMRMAGKVVAAALAVAVIGMSTTPTFAAERDTADLNSDMYQFTEDLAVGKATIAYDGMIEYSCDIEDLDREGLTIVYHEDDGNVYRPQANFGPYTEEWTCNPDTRHVSGPIRIRTDNGYIGATCIVRPGDKSCMLGVMDNCGHAQYVVGTGGASHNFHGLDKSTYRVFIQNNYKNTTLHADIAYGYSYDDTK